MLVNVGRGKHVVDEDLIKALDSGQLSYAALDALWPEPLPPTRPLWLHPKVTVMPHVARRPTVAQLVTEIAACMVDMTMGVNHGVDRAVVPASDSGEGLGCRVGFGRIDKDEPGFCPYDGDAAAEVCCVNRDDVFSDLRDRAMRNGLRPLLHRCCAAPKPLKKRILIHCTDPHSREPAQ
jgi:D-isomer specific 2-hydroxyacid dehydrogenase, NAD binding domain